MLILNSGEPVLANGETESNTEMDMTTEPDQQTPPTEPARKYYFYWGYNRAFFAPSSIHFKGSGHNFTLKNVEAEDRPSALSAVYYSDVSVPQYNWRFGYNFAPFWNISFGHDHMKYVVNQGQTVAIDGTIDASASAKYAGNYDGQSIRLDPDFLEFEHTDGFNYFSVELETLHPMDFIQQERLSFVGGFGLGPMIPRSDVRLFNKGQNHPWNLSGFGCSMHGGLQFEFGNRYFLRYTGKYGRVDLKNIPTTGEGHDHAEQRILFMENNMTIGAHF